MSAWQRGRRGLLDPLPSQVHCLPLCLPFPPPYLYPHPPPLCLCQPLWLSRVGAPSPSSAQWALGLWLIPLSTPSSLKQHPPQSGDERRRPGGMGGRSPGKRPPPPPVLGSGESSPLVSPM